MGLLLMGIGVSRFLPPIEMVCLSCYRCLLISSRTTTFRVLDRPLRKSSLSQWRIKSRPAIREVPGGRWLADGNMYCAVSSRVAVVRNPNKRGGSTHRNCRTQSHINKYIRLNIVATVNKVLSRNRSLTLNQKRHLLSLLIKLIAVLKIVYRQSLFDTLLQISSVRSRRVLI